MTAVNYFDSSNNIIKKGAWLDEKKEGKWVYKNSDGQILLTGEFRNGLKHGPFVSWNVGTRKKEEEGTFNNDKEEGIWKTFWSDGNPKTEARYKNGKLRSCTSWDAGGQKVSEGAYELGQKAGNWTEWHVEKVKNPDWVYSKSSGKYRKGQKNNTWTQWYANGNVAHKGKYKKGRKHGMWVSSYQNGQLFSTGRNNHGRQNGNWTYFSPEGLVATECKYQKGRLRKTGPIKLYYRNGQTKLEGEYLDDRKTKKWTYWYSNGQKEAEGEYDREGQKVEGTWRYWRENGDEKACEHCKSILKH